MMKKYRTLLIAVAAGLIFIGVSAHAQWWSFGKKSEKQGDVITEISWDDLIPDDFVQPENPFITMAQEDIDKLMDGSEESNAEMERLRQEFYYAPVVDELDGKRVKIAAYITPLEFDGQSLMSEFLLVPYVGACMHTPPPPANQVVHAESATAIEQRDIYEPVWAVGTIRTETVQSDLAESGYRLEVEQVLTYEAEN